MLKLKLYYFGHLMWKSKLIGKDRDTGKDWRQEEKGTTEDEMVGWHHWLNGHEFEEASGVGDGQGGLACCSPWGHKGLDTTEWLNWLSLDGSGGFPGSLAGKESACNAGDSCSIPGLGRSPGGGHGNPLQYSCLENPHGQRSQEPSGLQSMGGKALDTTEWLSTAQLRGSVLSHPHSQKGPVFIFQLCL